MKRIISCFVVLALLTCLAPAALAASGKAAMVGPDVVRAGDTITVKFAAAGGIYGGSGSVSYDASQLTLQGYSQLIGGDWAVEFSGNNFVFYDNSMSNPINGGTSVFSATFKVKADLATGTVITVTASGVTLSDGQADVNCGSPSWSVAIAEPLSDNCNLATLTVSNASISPAFSVNTTEYSASVPYEVSDLKVTATAEHPGATVAIGDTYLYEASTTAVKITVTAETGATKTYVVNVYRPRDPNYVESDNCNLEDLWVEGFALSPAFDVNVKQYYVWLPYETETVSVGADTEDSRASVSVGDAVLEPGKAADISVTVTAENGDQQVYVVTAVRAPGPEDVERYLSCSHEPEPEPTEPVTEAVTEPEPTQPPTEATEPVTVPVEEPEEPGNIWWLPALTAVAGLVVGAAAGIGAALLARKKKEQSAADVSAGEE